MKHLIKIETTEHGALSVQHMGKDQQWCDAGLSVFVNNQPDAGWGLQKLYYIVAGSSEKHPIDIDTRTFIMPNGNITIGGVFKRFVIGDWTEGKGNQEDEAVFVKGEDGEPRSIPVDEFIDTITDAELDNDSERPVQNKVVTAALGEKQDNLVSGQNIKTLNGESLLGNGNIVIEQHFKGWWPDLDTLKDAITATEGDYAYVADPSPATTTSIYVYSADAATDNYWDDSGRDVDTSNVQTFETLQQVNEVSIVNDLTTGGVNDVLSAEQGLNLNMYDILKPVRINKYSVSTVDPSTQVATWIGNSNRHIVIPVKGGDILRWAASPATLYCAFLTEYPSIPVSGDSPAFLSGYTGRQTLISGLSPYTIPTGCNYLIINYNSPQTFSSIKINGVEIMSGLWQSVLGKTNTENLEDGSVTYAKLDESLTNALEFVSRKKTLARSNLPTDYVNGRNLYNVLLGITGVLSASKLQNLFVVKYRNYLPTTGVVPSTDASGAYDVTDYIPVVAGHQYMYCLGASTSVVVIGEYDTNKNYLSGTSVVGNGSAVAGVYTPSSSCKYVVLCSNNDSLTPNGPAFVDITDRLYALKSDVVVDSVNVEIVSDNIANPYNVWDKTLIDSSGKMLTKDSYSNYQVAFITVSPGDVITFGGNDLGRQSYYSLFGSMPTQSSTVGGATVPIATGTATQQEMISGKTLTVPADCHYLFWQIQFNDVPSTNVKIQANAGSYLLQYDEYKEAITKINNSELYSNNVPSDIEERVEALEDDIVDLQETVADLDNQGLIADLPTSPDGSGIDVGYAYINSTTGIVTVKLS